MTVILGLTAAPAVASELADRLERELRGAWAVVGVELYSNCSGSYSDNTVLASGVASKADQRFEPGELVKIDKVKAKRARVDLLVSLAEPLLVARVDGPFELFDEKECKAQLIFEVGREAVKGGDHRLVLDRITGSMSLFRSLDDAQAAEAWNGRERDPLPEGYGTTLTRYQAWKAEQTNAAVTARSERAVADAADAADDLRRDADYLDGFAAGVEKLRTWSLRDCASLISTELSTHDREPDRDRPSSWRDGYRDGQKLIFNLLLAERLSRCLVPVPAAP
jgi:hypothetical protein